MLRGGLQDFSSSLTPAVPLQPKKGKRQRQGQCHRSWSTLHVGAAVSYCAILTNHGFNALSSNAAKIKSKEKSRVAGWSKDPIHHHWRFNHQFPGRECSPGISFANSCEHTSISKGKFVQNDRAIGFAYVFHQTVRS